MLANIEAKGERKVKVRLAGDCVQWLLLGNPEPSKIGAVCAEELGKAMGLVPKSVKGNPPGNLNAN